MMPPPPSPFASTSGEQGTTAPPSGLGLPSQEGANDVGEHGWAASRTRQLTRRARAMSTAGQSGWAPSRAKAAAGAGEGVCQRGRRRRPSGGARLGGCPGEAKDERERQRRLGERTRLGGGTGEAHSWAATRVRPATGVGVPCGQARLGSGATSWVGRPWDPPPPCIADRWLDGCSDYRPLVSSVFFLCFSSLFAF